MQRILALCLVALVKAVWLENRALHEWNANVYTREQLQNFDPVMRNVVQNTRWDKAWLQRGNSVIHYEQLIPLFERLDAGLPITVVGLGSSIVAGGGCFNNRSQLYSHVHHVRTRLNPEVCERDALSLIHI